MVKRLLVMCAALVACCASLTNAARPVTTAAPRKQLISDIACSPRALEWADSVMATMTDAERVAQLFVPRLDITDNPAGLAAIKKMVGENKVGGFLLGKGTTTSYANLINAANNVAKVPPMVTLDGEWGPAMRLTDAPRFPHNMALGAITDPELLRSYGEEVARECRELGIHVNFAPDADVNSNPSNPVIGYRSFGEDPKRVAQAVVAYSRGLEEGGVLSVAKHFPGHGDTSTDSHKTLPVVNHSMERIEETDLVPFREYINAGLGGIMVGHLRIPSLDASGAPTSLSHRVTTQLLGERLGFKGLVFTDALAMKGAVTSPDLNNCVSAFLAGADLLLGSASPIADIAAVNKAVKDGKISKAEVDRRCRKILAYKYALGLASQKPLTTKGIAARVVSPQSKEVRRKLAEASITIIQDNKDLLPLAKLGERSIAVVSLGDSERNAFSSRCAAYAPVELFSVGKAGLTQEQLRKLREADVVVVGVFADSEATRAAFGKLSTLRNVVGVFFINPYKMAHFGSGIKDIGALVTAYDNTPELREAAAEAIFGGIDVTGRFPVDLKGIASKGAGKSIHKVRLGYADPASAGFATLLSARIDSLMNEALKAGAFPGAQVLVAKGGDIVFDRSYGYTDNTHRYRVTDSTLYDLASVSKATGTLAGLMKAYDEGLFALDHKVSDAIAELRTTDKKDLTFKQLLFHESGLPAGISPAKIATEPIAGSRTRKLRNEWISTTRSDNFDREMAKGLYVGIGTRDSLLNRIFSAKMRPSRDYKYSDLNFCLLMEAEERLTGVDHDQWVTTEVFEPLGASTLVYNPKGQFADSRIAPTEKDGDFRKQLIHGYVHDETAAISGGVQGNAGLFGTAGDLAKYCQMLLNGGSYGGEQILSGKTVKLFTTTYNRKGNRALGFDLQPEDSPAPCQTYGHNGFTGTCFWIDPENEIIIVFLSNRVHPSRTNKAFSQLKPRTGVIEAVYSSLRK